MEGDLGRGAVLGLGHGAEPREARGAGALEHDVQAGLQPGHSRGPRSRAAGGGAARGLDDRGREAQGGLQEEEAPEAEAEATQGAGDLLRGGPGLRQTRLLHACCGGRGRHDVGALRAGRRRRLRRRRVRQHRREAAVRGLLALRGLRRRWLRRRRERLHGHLPRGRPIPRREPRPDGVVDARAGPREGPPRPQGLRAACDANLLEAGAARAGVLHLDPDGAVRAAGQRGSPGPHAGARKPHGVRRGARGLLAGPLAGARLALGAHARLGVQDPEGGGPEHLRGHRRPGRRATQGRRPVLQVAVPHAKMHQPGRRVVPRQCQPLPRLRKFLLQPGHFHHATSGDRGRSWICSLSGGGGLRSIDLKAPSLGSCPRT
mmetsp:Transcript_49541/g.146367  ORF Transcript_49541/g.146367 Transcript_49541/m.146367 type:complete len:375 (+) Transcript_49541:502-1626(+)